MIESINVRFFCYLWDEETGTDIAEVTESTFKKYASDPDSTVTYERHTVFENGCRQVCLTVEPYDMPSECDIEIIG